MRRWLFNFAAAVSLALLLVTAWLWLAQSIKREFDFQCDEMRHLSSKPSVAVGWGGAIDGYAGYGMWIGRPYEPVRGPQYGTPAFMAWQKQFNSGDTISNFSPSEFSGRVFWAA